MRAAYSGLITIDKPKDTPGLQLDSFRILDVAITQVGGSPTVPFQTYKITNSLPGDSQDVYILTLPKAATQ